MTGRRENSSKGKKPKMTSTYDRVVAVVSKPPGERTENEADGLLPWFRKKSDLFANLKADIVKDIIKNCEFRTVQTDYIIIKQGEKGNCFYIILNGKVSIFINNSILDEEEGATVDARSPGGDEEKLDRTKLGSFIAHIDAGKSFGELALINKDCVRNASIVSDDVTDLLVVNRELYNRSLHAEQAAEFEARKTFVKMNPLFGGWQPRYKKQMAMSIRRMVSQFDEPIIHQGDAVNALYFIVGGEAKIKIDPELHNTQYPNLLANVNEDPHQENGSQSLAVPQPRRRERRRSIVEMCVVGENEVIGEMEFVLDLKSYTQSVVSTQVCHLYVLDMKNYERLVLKRNPKTVDQIRNRALLKLEGRVSRMPHAIPLLKVLTDKLNDLLRPPKRKEKEKTDVSTKVSSFQEHRGPLIDQYGPGTVFGHIREREKAKKRAQKRSKLLRGGKDNMNDSVMHNLNSISDRGYTMNSYDHNNVDDAASLTSSDSNRSADVGGKSKYKDWETSDRILTDLEERLSAWHAECSEGLPKSPKPNPVKMKRVSIEKNQKLTAGATIVMRKRRQNKVIIATNGNNQSGDEVPNAQVNAAVTFAAGRKQSGKDRRQLERRNSINDDISNITTEEMENVTVTSLQDKDDTDFPLNFNQDHKDGFMVVTTGDSHIQREAVTSQHENEAMTSSREKEISLLQPLNNASQVDKESPSVKHNEPVLDLADKIELTKLKLPQSVSQGGSNAGFPKLNFSQDVRNNIVEKHDNIILPKVARVSSHFDVKPPGQRLQMICEEFKTYKESAKRRKTAPVSTGRQFQTLSSLGRKFKQ